MDVIRVEKLAFLAGNPACGVDHSGRPAAGAARSVVDAGSGVA